MFEVGDEGFRVRSELILNAENLSFQSTSQLHLTRTLFTENWCEVASSCPRQACYTPLSLLIRCKSAGISDFRHEVELCLMTAESDSSLSEIRVQNVGSMPTIWHSIVNKQAHHYLSACIRSIRDILSLIPCSFSIPANPLEWTTAIRPIMANHALPPRIITMVM